MRKIISALDIGSGYIKLVVGEFIGDNLNILCATKVCNFGFKNGEFVKKQEIINNIKQAIENVSKSLGIKLKKIVVGIDSFDMKLTKSASAIKIENNDGIISEKDVLEIIHNCAKSKIPAENVLISVIPIEFTIDDNKIVCDPKGYRSQNLGLKSIVVSAPKNYIKNLLEIITSSGLKTVDVVPSCIGDYYTCCENKNLNEIGIVANIGFQKITLSVFNRGILTNTKKYDIGAKNIIDDIAYINRIDFNSAKAIFDDIGTAFSKFANPKEYRIIQNFNGEDIKINQYELGNIIFDRIEEMLNLIEKQTNILTKKQISYIILTGGLTELRDFESAMKEIKGKKMTINKLNILGARDNSYSCSIGILKYFNHKLDLRGKNFSIFSEAEIEQMNNMGNKTSNSNESLLSKVFGYFFDN